MSFPRKRESIIVDKKPLSNQLTPACAGVTVFPQPILDKYICFQNKLLRKHGSYALLIEDTTDSMKKTITIPCLEQCQETRDKLIEIDSIRENESNINGGASPILQGCWLSLKEKHYEMDCICCYCGFHCNRNSKL